MQLTYEELKQLNEGRCIEPQEDLRAAAKRSKLRDDLEAAVKKFINSGGEIKEVESTIKPRSEHVSDLFDDEYCGSAKIALVLHWLNVKGHITAVERDFQHYQVCHSIAFTIWLIWIAVRV